MESSFSWILLILLGIASVHYLFQVWTDRMQPQLIGPNRFLQREGFTDAGAGAVDAAKEVFLKNDELYDDFYAQIYDQLTQNGSRTQAKIGMILDKWKQQGLRKEDMSVLDVGCGTGVAALMLAKMGVKQVIGLDKSPAMLTYAQGLLDKEANLTPEQKKTVVWKQADVQSPSAMGGAEVQGAVVLYFTLYYLPDKESLFRNLFLWVAPGGQLVLEVVNKYKFDPMLESAAPWIGFSLQKYAKDRVTESKVSFNKFDYTAKFELTDPSAEFRETFRFKDGTVRRQRHQFHMPTIEDIVKSAQSVGWKYTSFTDLTTIGFEYAYLLFFRHP